VVKYIIILKNYFVEGKKQIMDKLHVKSVERFFDAILTLKDREECYQFFEDVCTVNEILDLAQRFDVACMLTEGKIYTEISKETGASTATISRVNKCFQYGSDGYKLVMDRLKEDGNDAQ
jgi:TrpR-related protein YerC/YecD